MENQELISHNISCENRENTKLTGIKDIESFNENEIFTSTDLGDLLIKGENLHMENLDLDTGLVVVSGKILAFIYSEKRTTSKNLFGKLLK